MKRLKSRTKILSRHLQRRWVARSAAGGGAFFKNKNAQTTKNDSYLREMWESYLYFARLEF